MPSPRCANPGAKRKMLPALANLITTTGRPRCLVDLTLDVQGRITIA